MNFYSILSNKEWKRAYNKIINMDTDMRETIPFSIEEILIENVKKFRQNNLFFSLYCIFHQRVTNHY